jgi:hypothetical protein
MLSARTDAICIEEMVVLKKNELPSSNEKYEAVENEALDLKGVVCEHTCSGALVGAPQGT